MKTVTKKIASAFRAACIKPFVFVERNISMLMSMLGVVLLTGGLYEFSIAGGGTFTTTDSLQTFARPEFNDAAIRVSVGQLFALIEGSLGALIMVVAGLGAIVAASMGAYRSAVGMLVVAVGSFILRSLVSLFFGTDFAAIDVVGDAGVGNQGTVTITADAITGTGT